MSWKDRATAVEPESVPTETTPPPTEVTPQTGSWRERAVPIATSKGKTSESGSYLSDVVHNAGKEVLDIAKNTPGLIKTGLDIQSIPNDAIGYIGQRALGVPHEETTLAQDVGTLKNVAKAGPSITLGMAKDLVDTVLHPIESFRKKPINTVSNASLILGGVEGLVEKAAPAVSEAAAEASSALGRRATGFTKGLIKGQNFEKANNAVQWMMDKKILTPGADVETMIERNSAAKDDAWERMSAAMKEQNSGATGALSKKAAPQLREQFLFDPKKAAEDLDGLRPRGGNGKILSGGQYDAQNSVIDDAIETIKGHGDRPIPWDEANTLKGNLDANFDTTKSRAVNDLKKSIYGKFNASMETQMDAAAEARGGDINNFREAKADYGAAKTAEKALDNLRSSKAGNKTIGLTDTIAGAGGAAAHGAVGAGATILVKKLLEKYGLSAGATMAKKLSMVVAKAPELLGPYAPAIKDALAAGGSELAFTHSALVKTEPAYRDLVKALGAKK